MPENHFAARHAAARPPLRTSGEAEEIPLHPKAAQVLKEQIVRGSLERDVPIFGKINVRKWFAYAMEKAKITKKRITAHHHARHSAATIAAGETQDMLAIQRQVGSSSHGSWSDRKFLSTRRRREAHGSAKRDRTLPDRSPSRPIPATPRGAR